MTHSPHFEDPPDNTQMVSGLKFKVSHEVLRNHFLGKVKHYEEQANNKKAEVQETEKKVQDAQKAYKDLEDALALATNNVDRTKLSRRLEEEKELLEECKDKHDDVKSTYEDAEASARSFKIYAEHTFPLDYVLSYGDLRTIEMCEF